MLNFDTPIYNHFLIYSSEMPWTDKELEEFERISTENMIIHYADELREIAKGIPAHSLLGRPLINRLIQMNILENYTRPSRGRGLTLSNKGRALIGLPERDN